MVNEGLRLYNRRKMKGMVFMSNRLTWKEIVERYPDQWVGLVDINWKNEANVESAVVKYSDKTADELLRLQIEEDPDLYSTYTTPDNLLQIGIVG